MPLEQPAIEGVTHRVITVGDLAVHVAEAGSGPLVLLLHGFPESWYSWRHQLTALAAAGYHAVAPDQRGYGTAGGPKDAAQYTMLHLAGDVIGLMDALGEDRAAVAGHDWGAPVAWNTALLRQQDAIVPSLPAGIGLGQKLGLSVVAEGVETADVFESDVSCVFDQAENRLHGQKALLLMLLAYGWPIAQFFVYPPPQAMVHSGR